MIITLKSGNDLNTRTEMVEIKEMKKSIIDNVFIRYALYISSAVIICEGRMTEINLL
jgi:hypothetical protein